MDSATAVTAGSEAIEDIEAIAANEAARAALANWIRWDRLPALPHDELYADPARARAAELLAISAEGAEPLLRGLLAAHPQQAIDKLLMAELLLRRGEEDAVFALLADLGPATPSLLARAACLLGQLCLNRGDIEEARRWTNTALEQDGHAAAVQMLNGLLLETEGRPHDAVRQFRLMLAGRPDDFNARIGLASALVLQGRVVESLQEQVAAQTIERMQRSAPEVRLWEGRPLGRGERVILTTAGGIGDTVQNLRYIQLLRARAPHAHLVLGAPADRLMLGALCPQINEASSTALPTDPTFDWQVSLQQLALLHLIQPASAPTTWPYLRADAQGVQVMGRALDQALARPARSRPLRVGLRWSGGFSHYNKRRSAPPECLGPLFQVPGVDWISLLERGHPERSLLGPALPLLDLSDHLGDLADTAALMLNLDLVISVDTSLVHLSGALGISTWMLNRPDPDGRWAAASADGGLYPTLRVFDHPGRRDWPGVIAAAAAALDEEVGRRAAASDI